MDKKYGLKYQQSNPRSIDKFSNIGIEKFNKNIEFGQAWVALWKRFFFYEKSIFIFELRAPKFTCNYDALKFLDLEK